MISYSELKQFGLNEKEAKVYLSALELGAESVQNIAKKAGIHRVSTYDILERLISDGLVSQIIKGKKRLFVAIEPEKILYSLRDKEQLFEGLLPELKALQDKGKKRPKVMFFEGKDAVWQAYFDRIRHRSELKENLVYGSSEGPLSYPKEYDKFTKERLGKEIKAKIIVEKSKWGIQEQKTAEKQLRQVRFLPEGKSFKTGTIIYGDRVMIVSWETMMLVIIEDRDYVENQRMVFELLWESLK